jgi:hypothetical protein
MRSIGCADTAMCLYQSRSLRGKNHMLCKDPSPPDIEGLEGEIQTRKRRFVVQPGMRGGRLEAFPVQLLVQIHFLAFRSDSPITGSCSSAQCAFGVTISRIKIAELSQHKPQSCCRSLENALTVLAECRSRHFALSRTLHL